jgi:ArsR family transcriptional regulator, arsenate/arsenite/antimonite-responsive transcriptional repressor
MPVPVRQVARTFARCAPLFHAMGDPVRQQIIMLLATSEEMNVNTLAGRIDLSRPAISHHLKVLRQGGLIKMRREGTENHYSLAWENALDLLKRFVAEVEDCETDA